MMERPKRELPFYGKKIYFSSSIVGITVNPEIGSQLIETMQRGGATVTSEHVGLKDKSEMFKVLSENAGIKIDGPEGNWSLIRRIDMGWVDEATHFVAIVDGPSHGVGMEIERALLKPERGLPLTPILALIHEDNLSKLTSMIRGITEPQFTLATYRNIDDARKTMTRFLIEN